MSTAALDPGRSAGVAASAGSGKTWLLTARILRLLLAGVPHDRLLALTFTRKAAAEMKVRVSLRLRELALADDATLDRLLAELGLQVDAALRERARGLHQTLLFSPWPLRATTLHAFCQDLIARFPAEAGVAPGFEISENDGALIAAAWLGAQQFIHAHPQSAAAQALHTLIGLGFGEYGLMRTVQGFLEHRADWHAWAEGREQPLLELEQNLREQLALDGSEPWAALQTPAFNARLKFFYSNLLQTGGTQYVKPERLTPALDATGAARLHLLVEVLLKNDGEAYAFKFSKDKRKQHPTAQLDQMEETYGLLAGIVKEALAHLRAQQTLQRTLAGCTLGLAALDALEMVQRERNCLGFADLEWRCARLLTNADAARWVQYKLDSRVDHLLLDEFQDTSPSQWRLLQPLLEEMASGGERSRTAFIVGDIKQSIYGFRRANPELMGTALRHLREHMQAADAQLNASRRSAPAIMDAVNALFGGEQLRDLLPDFPEHSTHRREDWGCVELAPLVTVDEQPVQASEDLRNPLLVPRADPENTRALREGRLIAARIHELVAQRWKTAQGHALSYADILILLRNRTHAAPLEQALSEAGIPYAGSSRGRLLETAEAQDLIALLRVLDSPFRDLDLAQVLRSPLFHWNDVRLLQWAEIRERTGSGWTALTELDAEASTQLSHWRALARELPAHDLLDHILARTDAAARYEAVLPPAQAARVRGNLNALLQLALAADSGRYPSPAKFLRHLQEAARTQAPDEAAPEAGGDCVRILTIHAAKGLEATAVFLAQSAQPMAADKPGWRIEWPHDASRPTQWLLTSRREEQDALSRQLQELRKQRALREEAQLLYVAVTRARQFLHISGYAQRRKGETASWYTHMQQAFIALGAEQVYQSGTPEQLPQQTPAPAPAPDPRWHQPLQLAARASITPSAQEVPADPVGARRGEALHTLLQALSQGHDPGQALKHAALANWADAERRALLTEAQRVLAAPSLARFFSSEVRAWNEVPVSHAGIHGVLDRLVDDGETLWVLDYKSHREGEPAALLARYRGQLQAYRDAVQALWPQRRVRAGLVLTAQAMWVECDW